MKGRIDQAVGQSTVRGATFSSAPSALAANGSRTSFKGTAFGSAVHFELRPIWLHYRDFEPHEWALSVESSRPVHGVGLGHMRRLFIATALTAMWIGQRFYGSVLGAQLVEKNMMYMHKLTSKHSNEFSLASVGQLQPSGKFTHLNRRIVYDLSPLGREEC